jgi:hypothetical protein
MSPRPVSALDQIRLLTSGLDLPFPPLDRRVVRVIALGFAKAWRTILAKHAHALRASPEASINAMMCSQLNTMVSSDRQWAQLVTKVSRGEESFTFSGKSIEKRPDLSLVLTGRNPNFPLVVECKLLDKNKTVGLYCRKGLLRFVVGHYAWATQDSFMVAYVRNGSTVDGGLAPHLHKYRMRPLDRYATAELPVAVAGVPRLLRRSIHGRKFRYPGRSPGNPGAIAVWHLWLY